MEPAFKVPDRSSKLDAFADKLSAWLKVEGSRPRKQKRTVKQLNAELVALGFDGSYGRVPGRKARAPPSLPAPWRLRQQGVRADGAHKIHLYDASPAALPDDGLLARVGTICDEFECYGYRRVGAALRQQGVVVNGKKLRRLMRDHDLQPKHRRRYVVTTDSDHAGLIYPDLATHIVPDRPNQLRVADLTYVAIPGGFVYLAAILDAWSRKVAGYTISRSMDARIAVAALKGRSGTTLHQEAVLITPIADRNSIRGVSHTAGGRRLDWLDESPRQPVR